MVGVGGVLLGAFAVELQTLRVARAVSISDIRFVCSELEKGCLSGQ